MRSRSDHEKNGHFSPTGFPSPAEDHTEPPLDLDSLVVKQPTATFFFEMVGDAMQGVGIRDGDVLVVDRSLQPTLNCVVVAAVGGTFLVRRYCPLRDGRLFLAAAHDAYLPLEITNDMPYELFGVVTAAVHRM